MQSIYFFIQQKKFILHFLLIYDHLLLKKECYKKPGSIDVIIL